MASQHWQRPLTMACAKPGPARYPCKNKLRSWYIGTMVTVERVQTGLRIERNLLKVLKGLAEYLDMSLGELVEGMALHALEGRTPFSPETLEKITQLKAVYGLELTAGDSHRLSEEAGE